MTFVHPKSLQNDLKRLQNAYSTSSAHASTVLSVLHDHLCKMLIAATPGIGFFAYWGTMVIFLFWNDCIASYKNQYTPVFFVFRFFFDHLYMKKQSKTKSNTDFWARKLFILAVEGTTIPHHFVTIAHSNFI